MPTCPDNMMNCASLSSSGTYRMDAALLTIIEANVSEVWDAWAAWVDDEGLNEVLEEVGDDDVHFGHAVAITPFWRFPDDVVVQFEPAGEDTAITLYSSSRLGYSDLGVNPARLESLHSALVAVQATQLSLTSRPPIGLLRFRLPVESPPFMQQVELSPCPIRKGNRRRPQTRC